MKGRNLLLVLCFVLCTKHSDALKNYSTDTSGIQNDVPMNYPSRIPFSNKISTSDVYIWPNPARERIIVYVNSIKEGEQGECIVYNNAGEPVLTRWIRNGNNNIYLGNVQEGIYIVAITNRNRDVISKRLIISR